ncbi:MAG: 30S ribosomal protein S8e [Candidatus Hodarchaeales archaeon]|jgi:small subunit ribosomal protein S8e
MVQWHGRSNRKASGGKYHSLRKKRKYELGRYFGETRQGETKRKLIRTRGGNRKARLLQDKFANVTHKGKTQRLEILDVVDNPANRNLARRKIITSSALIRTELGIAQITSRPGQSGVINAVIVEE